MPALSLARGWKVLAALTVGLVLAALGFGVLSASGDSERRRRPGPAGSGDSERRQRPGPAGEEVRLDGNIPARARKTRGEPARAPRRSTASVQPAASDSGEEEPPADILREDRKLRRELEDLKALEAERGRVARALSASGTFDGGPLRIGAGGLAWPVTGPIVSPFGQRWGRLHAGIDIAAPAGRPIRAAAPGLVVIDGPTGGYGNYACIQHTRRLATCYAHMSRSLTEKGSMVRRGEVIGMVGCTGHCFGDHLHFETWVGGRPTDPMPYL